MVEAWRTGTNDDLRCWCQPRPSRRFQGLPQEPAGLHSRLQGKRGGIVEKVNNIKLGALKASVAWNPLLKLTRYF